jgi:hypothetical protein
MPCPVIEQVQMQITKVLIIQFSLAAYYSCLLDPNILYSTLLPNTLNHDPPLG